MGPAKPQPHIRTPTVTAGDGEGGGDCGDPMWGGLVGAAINNTSPDLSTPTKNHTLGAQVTVSPPVTRSLMWGRGRVESAMNTSPNLSIPTDNHALGAH